MEARGWDCAEKLIDERAKQMRGRDALARRVKKIQWATENDKENLA